MTAAQRADIQPRRAAAAPQPPDVLVIGTGFSDACAGIELVERRGTNFRTDATSQGVGGTGSAVPGTTAISDDGIGDA